MESHWFNDDTCQISLTLSRMMNDLIKQSRGSTGVNEFSVDLEQRENATNDRSYLPVHESRNRIWGQN